MKSGALTRPLPKDAVEGFVATIREYTPDAFEPDVSEGLAKVDNEFAPPPDDQRPTEPRSDDGATLKPRPDPIDAQDTRKAHDYGMASSINAVYRAFLKGKDMSSAIKGWDEIAQKLGEHAGPVIEFLKNYLS